MFFVSVQKMIRTDLYFGTVKVYACKGIFTATRMKGLWLS